MKRHSENRDKTKVTLNMSEQPPNMATVQLNGEKMQFILNQKNFSTGSKGFHATGKMQVGEKRYQINIQLVEIGSKPKEKEEKKK